MMFFKKCCSRNVGKIDVSSIIIIATICLLIQLNSSSAVNNKFEACGGTAVNLPIGFSQALVIQRHGYKLTALNVNDTNKISTIKSGDRRYGFDLYLKDALFFNQKARVIESSSRKYPQLQLPTNFRHIYEHLYDLAVDFVGKKVYALSIKSAIEADKLIVLDIQGKHYGIILTDLESPTQLALDPNVGLLFIAQQSSIRDVSPESENIVIGTVDCPKFLSLIKVPKDTSQSLIKTRVPEILRASMDGSFPSLIVKKPGIAAVLALDRSSKRVYWASQISVESANYDGSYRRAVLPISVSPPKSLAVLGRQLFWLKLLRGSSNTTKLLSCDLENEGGVCGASHQIRLNYEEMIQIKAYDFEEMCSIIISRTNPCGQDNGGCQQLCLLSNNTSGYSCACELGQQLNEDLKTCRPADEEFLLYAQSKFFRGKNLHRLGTEVSDTSSFTETMYPVDITVQSLSKSKVIQFAYDMRDNLAYFNDDLAVYERSLLEPSKEQFHIDSTGQVKFVSYLATDWVSKNVYISKDSYLRVYPYGYGRFSGRYKQLASFYNSSSRSVAVHPNRGYVFIIVIRKKQYSSNIYRMNSDGSNINNFARDRTVGDLGLTIDFMEDRLYWFNAYETKLLSVDINDSPGSFRSVDVSIVLKPKTVSLDRKWAYVSNWTGVWRLDKATGAAATHLRNVNPGREILAGATVCGVEAQPLLDGHPCALNKGGCQRFCFAMPEKNGTGIRKQCGCYEGEELHVDGKTCI